MSTRATYLITEHAFHPAVCFYIHSDGYPEYAFHYFQNAVAADDKSCNSSFAERFIRANDTAEFTSGHDAHGDTEYRYTYTPQVNEPMRGRDLKAAGTLKVENSVYHEGKPETWETVFEAPLAAFIAKYDVPALAIVR